MFGAPARRSAWPAARLARGYALPAARPDLESGQNDSDASHGQTSSSSFSPAEAGPSKPRASTHASGASNEQRSGRDVGASARDDGPAAMQPSKRGRKARTPAQRAAFVNARAFALAMEQAKRSSLPPFIAGAAMESSNPSRYNVISSSRQTPPHASPSSSDEPKLLDLLSKQPNHAPPSPLSKRYPKRYARLVDSIDQAFVKSQLIAFSRELGIPANETKAKQKIIARIVASWGWPAPEEHAVEREMKNKVAGAARREVISHDIPGLTAADVHLFLSDSALVDQMIRRNNLKISVLRDADVATNATAHERLAMPGQADPAASPASSVQRAQTAGEERVRLRVNGANTAIKHLEDLMAVRRASTQHIDIPLSDLLGYMPSPVLMSAVSRATLTFLEPVGNDHIRISGLRQDDMRRAEGLLLRSSIRRLPNSQPDQSLLVTPASTHPKSPHSPPAESALESSTPTSAPSLDPASTPASSATPTSTAFANISNLADSLLSSSTSSPSPSSAAPTPIENTYTLLPFTPPSNFPLPWHAAAEMQSAHSHPVRLSQGRVWRGYNLGRVGGHEKEHLIWGSVRVMKVRGGGGAGSVGGRVGGGVGEREGEGEAEGGEVVEGHEDEEVKRLSEALRVRDAAEVDGAEIVNTLSFGHAIYSSHLGPLDTLLTSTPLEELPAYMRGMSMPVFCPSSPPRIIQDALEGTSTTTRHLRYRLIPSPSPSPSSFSLPIDSSNDIDMPKASAERDEVYEFTYTLPPPPNFELDAARLDAELGNMADPANGGVIRDAVSPTGPSDWVSQLEAQLDADMRRQEAERERLTGVTGYADANAEQGVGDLQEVQEVQEVQGQGADEADGGIASPTGTHAEAESADTLEPATNASQPSSSTTKSIPTPPPPPDITASLFTPHTSVLHFPNRSNDILHTASLPHPTSFPVPGPVKQFFKHIHEASHRSSTSSSSPSSGIAGNGADPDSPDDLSEAVHELDDALFGQPGPDREYATYDPPPRFSITIRGKDGKDGKDGRTRVKVYALESDEERTTIGYELDGVGVRWVQRREMGVPWAKAVGCTEMVYKGSSPPDALWGQLNRISMDTPSNAIKSARGEVYN